MAAWATAAGVSIHTLSGVINDTAGMPEATRERVRLVIKDRGSHLSTHRTVTEAPG